MHDVNPIVAQLQKAHSSFIAACGEIPEERWKSSPGKGAWSAGEVVAHLTQVEEKISSAVTKIVREAAVPVPLWKRLHFPVALAENSGFKLKTPVPLDPLLVREKTQMLVEFTRQRNHSVALLLSNGRKDLSVYRMPHPFLGSLNFYDWFRMLAFHEIRHTKQIRRIVASFPR